MINVILCIIFFTIWGFIIYIHPYCNVRSKSLKWFWIILLLILAFGWGFFLGESINYYFRG